MTRPSHPPTAPTTHDSTIIVVMRDDTMRAVAAGVVRSATTSAVPTALTAATTTSAINRLSAMSMATVG
jgi:hypothetical protein